MVLGKDGERPGRWRPNRERTSGMFCAPTAPEPERQPPARRVPTRDTGARRAGGRRSALRFIVEELGYNLYRDLVPLLSQGSIEYWDDLANAAWRFNSGSAADAVWSPAFRRFWCGGVWRRDSKREGSTKFYEIAHSKPPVQNVCLRS